MRVAPGVSETARAVVIGSGTGSGFQSTSAAAAATSGGGKLSRAVIKTGQVLARGGGRCERRTARPHATPRSRVDRGVLRSGAKRACGRCRSAPGGATHAGEALRIVTKRMAVRAEACGARTGEHERT